MEVLGGLLRLGALQFAAVPNVLRECGRKPECPEETHANTERTYKLFADVVLGGIRTQDPSAACSAHRRPPEPTLARKYGEIFQMKLGSQKVVVLNGDRVIRHALLQKGADFAGRPGFASFKFVSGGRSLAFGLYNERWKAHRKIAQSTVRAFSTLNPDTKQRLGQHVLSEVRDLITIFSALGEEGKLFAPGGHLVVAVANVMSAVCFGRRYSHMDLEFQALLSNNDKFSRTVGAGSLVDAMPWLQRFPNPVRTIYSDFQQVNNEFYNFVHSKFIQTSQDSSMGSD
ncbi:unnamed protein product [Ranitomeya imitator]|uniref:Uncharacterized protein n=1 Tax=Ranitomeya imitator TaxID=111125 RepID=A0ABN9L802_9NEOB|nr:unnamed protein product [Ranitomeya imitator]